MNAAAIAALLRADIDVEVVAETGSTNADLMARAANNPQLDRTLLNDVETKLFRAFPDSTWVYPGHGSDTTLGAERPHLDEWVARGW